MGALINGPWSSDTAPPIGITQLANHLGVTTRTIRRWVRAGCPHTRTTQGHLLFVTSDVQEWRKKRGLETSTPADASTPPPTHEEHYALERENERLRARIRELEAGDGDPPDYAPAA